MEDFLRIKRVIWTAALWLSVAGSVSAQAGHWNITQLNISNASHPSINNNNEIVWASDFGGIFSNVRGKLADAGVDPHLANSGEVVYADWFGGPYWDLVSTTRGRLTYGGIIDVNMSDFHVNASGEVVYSVRGTNNFAQLSSTVRNQITFDAADHYNPCINDTGEIVWTQYGGGPAQLVSSTRGALPGLYPWLQDLNNKDEICYSGNLEGPPGFFSYPHIFSSVHGVIINDPTQFQWDGTINDSGVILWEAPVQPGSSQWYLYKAEWVEDDTTPPVITRIVATPDVLWPPNNRMVAVSLTVDSVDDFDPSPKVRITGVASNEPHKGIDPDWQITGPLTLNLRATRDPRGGGRIYTITVEATDATGNVSTASIEVTVPKSPQPRRGNAISVSRGGRSSPGQTEPSDFRQALRKFVRGEVNRRDRN